MQEEEYARQLATLVKEEYSHEEWMALLDNADELLEEQLPPTLNVEEVIEKAKEHKIRADLKGVLDEVSEQDWIEKQEILTKLKEGEVDDRLEGLEATSIPPYLLGEPREEPKGIEMEIKRDSSPYVATVGWEELESACKDLLTHDELVTPYSVRNETGKGHGKSRTLVVYLWQQQALVPVDYQETSGDFASIKFRTNKDQLQGVIDDCGYNETTTSNQTKVETTDDFVCTKCGDKFDTVFALEGHKTAKHRVTNQEEQLQGSLKEVETKELSERHEVVEQLGADATTDLDLEAEKIPPYLLGNPLVGEVGVKMHIKGQEREFTATIRWNELDEIAKFLLNWDGLVTPYRLRNDLNISRPKSLVAVVYLWQESVLIPADMQLSKDHISIKFQVDESRVSDMISEFEDLSEEERSRVTFST